MSSHGLQSILEWAKAQGAVVDAGVAFKEVAKDNIGGFWSANAANSTENAALLGSNHIRIPISMAVTLKHAVEAFDSTATGDYRAIATQTSNVNSLLKLFLARERAPDHLPKSFFRPYIELLPPLQGMSSPYCWTAEEKSYIKGTNLGNSLKENVAALVEEWWQLINLLPQELAKPTDHFVDMKFYYEYKFYTDDDFYDYVVKREDPSNWTSFANYLWASLILKSRSFPAYLIKNADDTADVKLDEAILLPLIDLLNHDMNAKVEWSVTKTGDTAYFNYHSDSLQDGHQIMNNYGSKGNEELLLAYGFCVENNPADTACLKIKVPLELLPDIEKQGVKLPKISDYTTSVVRGDHEQHNDNDYKQFEDGLVFFIGENVPENLVQLFQLLVRNNWEKGFSIRNKLAGINQLRNAVESKLSIVNAIQIPAKDTANIQNIRVYVDSQKRIFKSTIKHLKSLEKQLLADHKDKLVSLKKVFKNDVKFSQALLVALGVKSYEHLIESNFQDQTWLLYLIRCRNRDEYKDDEAYLPEWIHGAFERLSREYTVSAQEIVQYQDLYEQLVLPINKAVPEIFDRGDWTVQQLVLAARLLDTVGFVRGKEQECILVEPES